MRSAFLILALALNFAAAPASAKEVDSPDAQAINSACASDAATAGCGNEKVGTGLIRCIHSYKKEHRKDFKISDGCKAAMKKARSDRMERKGK